MSLKPSVRSKLAPPCTKILKEELSLHKVSAPRREKVGGGGGYAAVATTAQKSRLLGGISPVVA